MEEIQNRINEIERDLNGLYSDQEMLSKDIQEISSKIVEIKEFESNFDGKYNSSIGAINGISNAISSIDVSKFSEDTIFKNLETVVTNIKNSYDEKSKEIIELYNDMTAIIEAKLKELKEKLDDKTKDLDNIKDAIAILESEKRSLQAQV